jgi:hypothetical protein
VKRATRNSVAVVVMVGAIVGLFWYTAAQTSLREAGVILGGLVLLTSVAVGAIVAVGALTRKFPRLEQPVVPPMSPPVGRRWRIVGNIAVAALLAWAIYDPPRDFKSTNAFTALGESILWGVHDLLGLAPHDRQTWEACRDKLEARLASERAKAPETLYALVSRGRDLESASFMTAMKLKRLEREVSTARDSVAAYDRASLARALAPILTRP